MNLSQYYMKKIRSKKRNYLFFVYEIAYSDNPGKVIYEDDYQIGVIDYDKQTCELSLSSVQHRAMAVDKIF